ncbi:HD domain-containing phosphohydrolase [Sulfurisoma sediminicola]|uniref:HD-GYP domain-containing protein (C-di-GMP phosphodiesterase class II) n=1 Tax=Sulfurisoma sediminicola TaxID=1381557 RepID=A0A497X955_9PROT|nr:HD domain-containing phosphohydrolase [Sulfurisoma sediminicola]RLJ62653.1 HD-GYP domain-containing protein (c-di-GMP phosphodiesterase class II) [Sulfurisoma sediminicola]
MKRQFPLHLYIATLSLLLILLAGGLIGAFGYKAARELLEASAVELTQRIGRETLGELQRIVGPAEMAVSMLAFDALGDATTLAQRRQRLALMREMLSNSDAVSALYVGYDTGDVFLLRRLHDAAARSATDAPDDAAYLLQSIERSAGRGRFLYLGPTLEVLRDDDRPDYAASYDPRSREWFAKAMASARGRVISPPYLFFSTQKVGTTLAMRSPNGRAVAASDILLETMNASLARQKVTPGSRVMLVSPRGLVIAHDGIERPVAVAADGTARLMHMQDLGLPAVAGLGPEIERMTGREPRTLHLELADGDWRVTLIPVLVEGAPPLCLVTAIPDRELLAAAFELRRTTLLVAGLVMLLAIPIAWGFARIVSRPLRALAGEAEAIRRFDFSHAVQADSPIAEVNALGLTMDAMRRAIRRFLDLSQAVAAEENFERLLPMLLGETLAAATADAAVLYLSDRDGLIPVAAARADGTSLMDTLLPLSRADAGPLIGRAVRSGAAQVGVLEAADIAGVGLDGVLQETTARHAVAVPLLNRQRHLVGVMLLLRHAPIGDDQLSFVSALSGSAATSLEARELIKAQKELFQALIELLAGAIDAKSPYTGGHCARVPELAKMLAAAACAETRGPFADFRLDDKGWEALHVAAWLHDCGKVTTPDYVVDKATKLETISDRIHEVRMRFEVLKRDAEIACLEAIASGADAPAARDRMAAEHQALDDDFAFLAACNEGGEFLASDAVARLAAIAARTWTRTLDDRIGLSHEERERKARTPPAAPPAIEPLLADRPDHAIERQPQDRIGEDPRWGFRMKVPRLLYDRGELHNLAVERGTLSEEERYKINEHIVQTLVMLSQLPFPKHLRQVPEIAGGHHEKMDGSGYPRGLTREQMSPMARMLAIADIFEALTAIDRPYKKGKTLSQAIAIMADMKRKQHIDPDLFDLFLRAGVYREYAEKFLRPDQIDAVDIAPYLGAGDTPLNP